MNPLCERCGSAPKAGRLYCEGCRVEARLETRRRAGARYRAKNRDAINANQKRYMDADPSRRRRAHLRRYGLTPEQYDALLSAQGGKCALCATDECRSRRSFSVDHDHGCCPEPATSCGKCVRGLLCHSCNGSLLPGYEALPDWRRDSHYLNAYLRGRPATEIGLD